MSVERYVPRLVATTDDERLSRADFRDRLERLLAAGCPAVLLRSRLLSGRAFYNLACYTRARCSAAGAELWVGERADIARVVGADAVQLPERGLSVEGARRAIGGATRIGRSVHSLDAALQAAGDGADHLVVGTVFATATHPAVEPAGTALIARVRSVLDERGLSLPILAIGGVTPERAAEVSRAGAAGALAVRALWDTEDPGRAVDAFLAAFGQKVHRTLD